MTLWIKLNMKTSSFTHLRYKEQHILIPLIQPFRYKPRKKKKFIDYYVLATLFYWVIQPKSISNNISKQCNFHRAAKLYLMFDKSCHVSKFSCTWFSANFLWITTRGFSPSSIITSLHLKQKQGTKNWKKK